MEEMARLNVGTDSLLYWETLNNLGFIYKKLGRYDTALSYYQQAIHRAEANQAELTVEYGNYLNNLGALYRATGEYHKAQELYLKALEITEQTVGKDHKQYGICLNNLALCYKLLGLFDKALHTYTEAMAHAERTLGKENASYITRLDNLAQLYRALGQSDKALPTSIEVVEAAARIYGKEHPRYGIALDNLSKAYVDMGLFDQSIELNKQAYEIVKKTLEPQNSYTLTIGSNLARKYAMDDQLEKALSLTLDIKKTQEDVFGKDYADYHNILDLEAGIREKLNQPDSAQSLYFEALASVEKALGKDHPSYGVQLNNLGIHFQSRGQYEKAIEFLEQALENSQAIFGEKHPLYEMRLNSLAANYQLMQDHQKAFQYYKKAFSFLQDRIQRELSVLNEKERLQFMHENEERINQYYHFTRQFHQQIPEALPLAYDQTIMIKGRLLNSSLDLNEIFRTYRENALYDQYQTWREARQLLAQQYSLPIANRYMDVDSLEKMAANQESKLIIQSRDFQRSFTNTTWQDIQKELGPGEAAIEFINFKFVEKKNGLPLNQYAALVLRDKNPPLYVELFEEKSLDSLLFLHQERRLDYVNDLYSFSQRGAKAIEKPQKTLLSLLWQPIEKRLEGVKTIYYAPSGLLYRLNLAAIPINEDTRLADQHQFIQLGSTRQLVIPSEATIAENDAVVYGGVQYEMDSIAIAAANIDWNEDAVATRGELSFTYADTALRGGIWRYLPHTDNEALVIEKIMRSKDIKTQLRQGFKATEESFKSIGRNGASPHYLHVATHGFFYPDPEKDPSRMTSSFGLDNEPIFKISDHPMIRSGLIMAGGNHAWKTGKPLKPDMDDGILTAYEISQMDLSNTELVVLSACETGLGDIKGNEGVYGLQRAFKIAGVKYLIMSLWQVPDRETAYFMETFYSKLLEDNMTIPTAFRATQNELRKNPFITPYQWAGFVLVE